MSQQYLMFDQSAVTLTHFSGFLTFSGTIVMCTGLKWVNLRTVDYYYYLQTILPYRVIN